MGTTIMGFLIFLFIIEFFKEVLLISSTSIILLIVLGNTIGNALVYGMVFMSRYENLTIKKFISKLKAHADIHICLTHSNTNQQLFKHTQNAYEALKRLADTVKMEKYSAKGLESVLFNDPHDKSRHLPDEKKYFVQSAQNKLEEISFIASKIKSLHHQHNIPLHRIGVTFPNLETYAPLIRTVFKSYHLPLNLSTGLALSQSPLVQNFLKVLEIIVNGYAAEGVFELLRQPFVTNEYRPQISLLQHIFNRLRLRYFSSQWVEQVWQYIKSCPPPQIGEQEKALKEIG